MIQVDVRVNVGEVRLVIVDAADRDCAAAGSRIQKARLSRWSRCRIGCGNQLPVRRGLLRRLSTAARYLLQFSNIDFVDVEVESQVRCVEIRDTDVAIGVGGA